MAMNVKPVPTLDDEVNEIRLATAEIINKEILPNEAKLWGYLSESANEPNQDAIREGKELREQVQNKVKKAKLWAPHLPREFGGMGLGFMQHAYMNEVLAYSPGAASLFGVVAPNSGNQKILVSYGTPGAAQEMADSAHRRQDAVRVFDDGAAQPWFGTRARSRPARCSTATSG